MRMYVIIGFVVVIAVGFVAWMAVGGTSNAPAENTETITLPDATTVAPDSVSGAPEEANFMTVVAFDGSPLTTSNFLADAQAVKDPINPGYYSLGDTTSSPYLITYIETTKYFNIELIQEPIGRARAQAELYLQQLLGLSSDDLCRLNYMVSVPNSVSFVYSSRSLGFSFCEGATKLPN